MMALLVAACSSALQTVTQPVIGPKPAREPGPDYVLVAPRAYQAALGPLLAHRIAQGHRTAIVTTEDAYARFGGGRIQADALHAALLEIWDKGHDLRFVLLVGDIPRDDEPGDERVAAFYLPKLDYMSSDHAARHVFHRSLLHATDDERLFPTDHPYAVMNGEPTEANTPVVVGRVPARSADEVRGFVEKVIAYETQPIDSPWPRRLLVHAGPARFGDLVDRVIERTALTLLDEDVPYDYDIDLVFAKPGSDYGARLDRLGSSLTDRANAGAFLLAYVGHSSPAYFDTVDYRDQSYSIGSRDDFERMQIDSGAPIFVSLSCDVGAFDMSKGRRSIAEEAVLNPKGPIAAFASTRESHPYPNLLYGEALIAKLIHEHPATIGEAIGEVKRNMLVRFNLFGERMTGMDNEALKREHVALYNLFGDPATRLRYPAELKVSVPEGPQAAGAELAVRIDAKGPPARALITVELLRTQPRAALVPNEQIESMPLDEALDAMASNHNLVADKVLERLELPLKSGVNTLRIHAPAHPGRYVVKVFSFADGANGWGHAFVEVH